MAEESYIKLSHEMFDALASLKLSNAERQTLMGIVRFTVGFHRAQHYLSSSFLASYTGIDIRRTDRAIKALEADGFIEIVSESKGPKPREIRIIPTKIAGGKNGKITPAKMVDNPGQNGGFKPTKITPQEIKEEKKNKEIIYKKGGKPPQTQKFNSFHNFKQRDDIDWDALADRLDADFANMEF